MQFFLHYKVQQVNYFLSRLSNLNELFKNKKFQFEKEFYTLTDSLINYFEQVGDSSNQSEAEQIRNTFQMSNEGVDPIKLELIKTYRRVMKRTTAFHCLSRITEILQNELQKAKSKLEQAEQTIGQLVLSLIQAGAITPEELSEDLDQEKLEIIWHRLSQNENVKLHERNLKLTIAVEDIFLLFTSVMLKIKD